MGDLIEVSVFRLALGLPLTAYGAWLAYQCAVSRGGRWRWLGLFAGMVLCFGGAALLLNPMRW